MTLAGTKRTRFCWTGETRVGIFALRDIAVGEEITYDYQFEHSGLAVAANAYRCAGGQATLACVSYAGLRAA